MQDRLLDTQKPNWKQIATFLALTFGLTYLLDLGLYLTIGYGGNNATGMLLQVQMLLPAAVAITLQLFVFRNSAIYRLKEPPRWFFYYYLAYTVVYALLAVSLIFVSNMIVVSLISLAGLALSVGGLVLAVVLRLISGKESFQRAGLGGGKVWQYIVFGLFLVVLYGAMTGLNALFNLGQPVNVRELLSAAAGGQATGLEQLPDSVIVLISAVQSLLLGPFLGLLIAFGEEYGWRGYLQGELIKIGKVRGVLLLGVIWGLWHAPIIMMGHNYPGQPILGVLLMTLYTIALGFFLGYVMLKSGSVWLVAYLHGLNNAVASFLMLMVYTPDDPALAFPLGFYSLIVWALVVAGLLIVGRKEWAAPAGPALVPVEAEEEIASQDATGSHPSSGG